MSQCEQEPSNSYNGYYNPLSYSQSIEQQYPDNHNNSSESLRNLLQDDINPIQSSSSNTANYEYQQQNSMASPSMPNESHWHLCCFCNSILLYNENIGLGCCNNCIPRIATIAQRQFPQGNSNGSLSTSVSSSNRLNNVNLEQQNFATSPCTSHSDQPSPSNISSSEQTSPHKKRQNRSRANNDRDYTSSINDIIIKMARKTGIILQNNFKFSREESTRDRGMSKKGILGKISKKLDWFTGRNNTLEREKEELQAMVEELKIKVEERDYCIEQLNNRIRAIEESQRNINSYDGYSAQWWD